MPTPQEVLHFWFAETPSSAWFRPGPDGDRIVLDRFGALTDQALAGGLDIWGTSAADALALLLLLDQFPRQIWRDQARAFAGDGQAQALTLRALEAGWVEAEPAPQRRPFWLMPLMHREDLALQALGLPLFERHTDARTAEFAHRHHAVIARFGRFPHRNQALGRPSSPEEEAFLLQPGSRF
ncbi:DUF924 family protein [Cyanobium sp. N5-Cardenillas]|uniref:DUF924 family protein n=1 Tax=Cyanobium sp. N5-Cardenillas TaxID=2823720 RepID=UPI0020CFA72F|nr:DUF924 family protein [Cyanobium sp. N5-Cardenillas]MCP9785512.1 DUF924 domain-containing protein [Cyanobium sp. N5-Cardenillas]